MIDNIINNTTMMQEIDMNDPRVQRIHQLRLLIHNCSVYNVKIKQKIVDELKQLEKEINI